MDSREPRRPRAWGAAAALGLAVAAAAAAWTPLDNNDVWIHLTTGRLVLEEGAVPRVDRYSFTAAGHRYVAHEWLAAAWYALGERVAGETGIVLVAKVLPALAAVAAWLVLLRAARAPAALALPLAPLALCVLRGRLAARPELLALPVLLAGLALLWRDREAARTGRRTRALWLLVPLQVLWVNLHGSFVLGIALVALFALVDLGERLLAPRDARAVRARALAVGAGLAGALALAPRDPLAFAAPAALLLAGGALLLAADARGPLLRLAPASGGVPGAGQGAGRLLSLALLLTLASLLNPRGAEILAFPFEFTAGGSWVTERVNEWRPLLLADHLEGSLTLPAWWTFVATWLGALALAVRRARLGLLEPALLLALAALPLLHARWMGLCAWASAPALATTLAAARSGSPSASPAARRAARALAVAAVVCLALALGHVARAPLDPAWSAAWVLGAAGAVAAWALAAQPRRSPDVGLRVAAVATGALALLSLAPGVPERAGLPPQRPGADAAGPGFGPSLHGRAATEFLRRSDVGGRLLTEYEWAGYAIHALWPRITVFIDSRSEVYGPELLARYEEIKRDEEAARETLERYAVDLVLVRHYPYPFGRRTNRGLLGAVRGDPDWRLLYLDDRALLYARAEPARALPPELGFAPEAFRLGDPGAANPEREAVLRRALERAPDSAFLHLALADALRARGRPGEALEVLRRGWAANPRYAPTAQLAGEITAAAGRAEQARRWFERARALAPGWERARRALETLEP